MTSRDLAICACASSSVLLSATIVKRWGLGSVTETVVRHSGDPVLVIRAV